MEQVGCKECTSPDCHGCNLLRLEQMLKSGKFDVLMDEKRGIKTGIDVRPVVFCKDCVYSENWYADRLMCYLWNEHDGNSVFEDGFCNYGVKKEES